MNIYFCYKKSEKFYFLINFLLLILSLSLILCNESEESEAKKPSDPQKEIQLCEVNQFIDDINSNCNLTAINFTFYAYFTFKQSKRSAVSTLNELVQTLSNSSLCEVSYLKYNFFAEKLQNLEENFVNKDPVFKKNSSARVYIISEGTKKYRKTLIYECLLPKSDVYLSLKPLAPRFSQSRPLTLNKVTVSGFHVKINLKSIRNIKVNLNTEERKETPSKTSQKFLIFYHYKCRSCSINIDKTTLDEHGLLDPFSYRSIKCHLRAKSCVYDGKCFYDDEKIDSSNPDSDYACSHPLEFYLQNHINQDYY